MVSHHLSIFAAAFLGAISASLASLVVPPADPAVGPRPAATASTTPAKPAAPVPPAPVRNPAPSMDMDGPIDDCDTGDLCDPLDDNDPIEI